MWFKVKGKEVIIIKYKKFIYRIFIIFLLILFVFKGQSFGVRKTGLDIWLRSFSFDASGTGVHLGDTAKSLKESFGYNYSEVRDKMTFDTTIKITKKSRIWYTKFPGVTPKYKYRIQIRKR